MLSTPHLLIGAAIGQLTGSPGAAFAAGFGSHLLADMVPHADGGTAGGEEIPFTLAIYVAATIDLVIGFILVALLVKTNSVAWAGALGGITPDVIDNVPFWKHWIRQLPVFKQFHALHNFIQWTVTPRYLWFGALTQLIIIGVCLWALGVGSLFS